MEETCKSLITKLKEKYTVVGIDEFMDLGSKYGSYHLQVLDKETNKMIASLHALIDQGQRYINIGLVTRNNIYHNQRNRFTKGLGKILMYIVACKANIVGYSVKFQSNPPDELKRYYNSLGFTRKNMNSSTYITDPASLYERIKEVNETFKKKNNIEYFEPLWLKSNSGENIIQCNKCKNKSGSLLKITHSLICTNRNKIPNLSNRPSLGGKYNKNITMRKRKIKRKICKKTYKIYK